MKFKIFGVALALTFATVLGACDQTTTPSDTSSPGTTGEPADTGKSSPAPAKSPK
ncbi:MAG: hypothetical protein QNJ51_05785 [Calothrix sp. MO_167.B12]|nr:hypothetical protein [Calothrix sp. MO_167.B12]